MESLRNFLFKTVIVEDVYGKTHKGYVDFYESEYDSGYDEESIGILPTPESKDGIELSRSDIKSIRLAFPDAEKNDPPQK